MPLVRAAAILWALRGQVEIELDLKEREAAILAARLKFVDETEYRSALSLIRRVRRDCHSNLGNDWRLNSQAAINLRSM